MSTGADPGFFDFFSQGFTENVKWIEGEFLEVNVSSKGAEGVFGGLPQKKLRFQALKSAFWWILEVLLWIMEKSKTLRSDWGVWTPPTLPLDPPLE